MSAEREQGITIDVAYRYFSTERRNFIVADTPGHEQYTRNMVTGASTADCAVILVDADARACSRRPGGTRCSSAALGIRHAAFAVTKMDLVDYDEQGFREHRACVPATASELGLEDAICIPVSGLRGDNVVDARRVDAVVRRPDAACSTSRTSRSTRTGCSTKPFRLPVQWVNRPDPDVPRVQRHDRRRRSFAPATGSRAYPSGRESTVARSSPSTATSTTPSPARR